MELHNEMVCIQGNYPCTMSRTFIGTLPDLENSQVEDVHETKDKFWLIQSTSYDRNISVFQFKIALKSTYRNMLTDS